jgi:hypothetical protein
MSEVEQTSLCNSPSSAHAGGRVGEIILYGLDEAGRTALAERLPEADRDRLPLIAEQRLQVCHAVEVWYGPMCVLRLRRPVAQQA